MFCSKCGHELEYSSSFCSKCGQAININQSELKLNNNPKLFITPSAAGIAIICFFLPWAKVSCMGNEKLLSGADLGGYLWIVFAAAVVALLSWIICYNIKSVNKAKPFIVISTLIGLITIAIKYFQFTQGIDSGMGSKIKPEDVGFSLHIGGYGTLLGLMVALIASFFNKNKIIPQDDQNKIVTSQKQPVNTTEINTPSPIKLNSRRKKTNNRQVIIIASSIAVLLLFALISFYFKNTATQHIPPQSQGTCKNSESIKYVQITSSTANVYKELDPNSVVIAPVKNGDYLELLYDGTSWYKVRIGEKEGWLEKKVGTISGTNTKTETPNEGSLESRHRGSITILELVSIKGARSNENVKRIITQNLAALRYQYNKRLREAPGLKGDITIKFAVDEFGKVIYTAKIDTSFNDGVFETIIVDKLRNWVFDKIDIPGEVTAFVCKFHLEP